MKTTSFKIIVPKGCPILEEIPALEILAWVVLKTSLGDKKVPYSVSETDENVEFNVKTSNVFMQTSEKYSSEALEFYFTPERVKQIRKDWRKIHETK